MPALAPLLQLIGMALSYSGVCLVLGHELGLQGSHAALGALLVFLSATTYALYLVYSGELVQTLGSLRLVGMASSVACLCCILQFVLLRPMSALAVAPEVLWLSVLNAIVWTAENDLSGNGWLRAYDATNVANQLYSTNFGGGSNFIIPLVVNGGVYVSGHATVYKYGLLH